MRTFLESHPSARRCLRKPLPHREEGGVPFTDEDEELTTLLSTQAAVAIENARLYEAATRWLKQLESLNEVSNALVSETELATLDLVATRLRELVQARIVLIALPNHEGDLEVHATAGEGGEELVGLRLERGARRPVAFSPAAEASESTR